MWDGRSLSFSDVGTHEYQWTGVLFSLSCFGLSYTQYSTCRMTCVVPLSRGFGVVGLLTFSLLVAVV